VIKVSLKKAVGNSKPAVTLDIRDVRILTNYFLPFFQKLNFLSKKYQDFRDLMLICRTIYNGGYKDEMIRDLIVKLSKSMNDFRLSNYKGKIPKEIMTEEEISLLENALPLSKHLPDGRVRDISTGTIDHNNESSVYSIIDSDLHPSGGRDESIVDSLKEASTIVGVHYSTLSKKLDEKSQTNSVALVKINGYTIRRVKVFYNNDETLT